jgi:hypothetical protein
METKALEFWTWRFVACVAKALPLTHVIETHAGGGLYDTVELYLNAYQSADGEVVPRIACNRQGRVHVMPGTAEDLARDIFTDLEHGLRVDDAVAWVAQYLPAPSDPDPVLTSSLGFMDALLGVCMGREEDHWEWRNGYLDTSGGFSCRREEHFAAVAAAAAACTAKTGDLLRVPEYRFWFLLRDGVAQLAVEPGAGSCFIDRATVSMADEGALDRCALRACRSPDEPEGAATSQQAAIDRNAFRPKAERLAAQLTDDAGSFDPGPHNLTQMAVWFSADAGQTLMLVAGSHESVDSMDHVLAYGLAWQADRDLVLVLPESHAAQTLARLAWVDGCVRLFVYGPELVVRPAIVPSRAEVLATTRQLGLRTTREHDLGDAASLVEPLIWWAKDHWALDEAHRPSYQAWHCEGRQVLALSRGPGCVKVVAGVNYTSTVPDGEEPPLELEVSPEHPLGRKERAQIEARVTRAVWNRLNGQDGGHVEHRLQARLGAGALNERLGLTGQRREYPGWRGPARPGFIDFLGIDRRHQLHVVETKVNPDDVTVVLQALDYAIWVMANGAGIRAERNWGVSTADDERVVLDFVCAPRVATSNADTVPTGAAIGRYMAGQLEALSPSIAWRIWLVDDPGAEVPELRGPSWRALPADTLVSTSIAESRWLHRVDVALRTDRPRTFASVSAAALPDAVPAFEEVIERGMAHRWLLSVRSSQALALNLFAPLGADALTALLEKLGERVASVSAVEFEFSDPEDRLRERRPSSPHRTQVDVVVRGVGSAGERIMALVEVKFTEEFGSCSAYESQDNDHRAVCRTSGLFGGGSPNCFQLRNHGKGRRLYDTYLQDEPVNLPIGTADDGGCLVRRQLSQPVRNLALGHMLMAAGEVDRFIYAVCAPLGHVSAWRRLAELQAAFSDTGRRKIEGLTVEDVRSLHSDDGRAFSEHYRGLL